MNPRMAEVLACVLWVLWVLFMAALCWMLIMALVVAAIATLYVATARADDTGEEARTDAYMAQNHSVSPTEAGCIIYALDQPCVEIPHEMALDFDRIIMQCEVRGWWSRWDSPADVVSPTGDRGMMQLNPVHRVGMARAGLDYGREGDRIAYGITIWERTRSWAAWSCR